MPLPTALAVQQMAIQYDLQLDYISVPVLFKFSPAWRWGFFAGPQFDYLLMADFDGVDLEE